MSKVKKSKIIAAIFFLFILGLMVRAPAWAAQAPIKGIGVCHYPTKMDEVINWAYDTTRPVHWKTLEPQPGVFDFSFLDSLINSHLGNNRKIWLSIQTVAGDHAPPAWVEGMGAKWFTIIRSDGRDHGLFAPWDRVYLTRLESLLKAVSAHLKKQSSAYRQTVGGIMMMSGGMYGEMQLWSGGAEGKLMASLNLNPGNGNDLLVFRQAYYQAVLGLVDIYMRSFDSLPVALQVGYNSTFVEPGTGRTVSLDWAVAEKKVPQYGSRLFLKWNGLDPCNVGDGLDDIRRRAADYYISFFKQFSSRTQVGFEIGHPWLFGNPPTQDAFWTDEFEYDSRRFLNVFDTARLANASFVCFQADLVAPLRNVSTWKQFDRDLESVWVPGFPVFTPTPTRAPTSTLTPTRLPNTPTPPLNCSCQSQAHLFTKGDADCNGKTNIDDYNYLFPALYQRNTAYLAQGDFDCNGRVSVDDFEIWRRNYRNR